MSWQLCDPSNTGREAGQQEFERTRARVLASEFESPKLPPPLMLLHSGRSAYFVRWSVLFTTSSISTSSHRIPYLHLISFYNTPPLLLPPTKHTHTHTRR